MAFRWDGLEAVWLLDWMCAMQKVIVQLVLGFVCVCDFEKMLEVI